MKVQKKYIQNDSIRQAAEWKRYKIDYSVAVYPFSRLPETFVPSSPVCEEGEYRLTSGWIQAEAKGGRAGQRADYEN